LVQRNRNVLISHCHIYHNTGAGIFLDRLNLHQIIIAANHISYNRLGGIRVEGSEIRNLQITGNDIEYNNHAAFQTDPVPTAEIYIDTTAQGASVNEVTVASNTIQATASPGGCNILIRESRDESRPPGLWTITGNIIGSQENNVHLIGGYGITITGNCIYSCSNRNLLIEDSRHIVVGNNTFRRHTPAYNMGVRIERSADVAVNGCSFLDEHPDGQPTGASLLELVASQRINVSGCQLLDGVPCGIDVQDCSHTSITGCTIHDTRQERKSQHAIRCRGAGQGNLVGLNSIGKTLAEPLLLEEQANVRSEANVVGD
jgi:hypothetical protein